jgi:hypothetical protein
MAFQVSVFLEDKIGHLERVTSVLKDAGINILSMNMNHTSSGWGIVSLLVNKPEEAFLLLTQSGTSVALRRIVVISLDDVPGALDGLLKKITLAGINFTTAYGRSGYEKGQACFIIDVENIPDAELKLVNAEVPLLPDETVYSLE